MQCTIYIINYTPSKKNINYKLNANDCVKFLKNLIRIALQFA